jgi:hypothetical protein
MIWPHTSGLIVVFFNGLILYFKNDAEVGGFNSSGTECSQAPGSQR